jgi:hypothetical protein
LAGGGIVSGCRQKRKPQLAWKSEPFRQTTAHHTKPLITGSILAVAPKIVQVKVAIHRSCSNLLFMHMGSINWDLTLKVYRNLVVIVFTWTIKH